MRFVIVNTSPLQYLYQTNTLEILPLLYHRIYIPEAVEKELAEGRRLGVALPDVDSLPWLEKIAVQNKALLLMIAGLGAGEREVLGLATEHSGSLAIIDDNLARQTVKAANIPCTGTLGVLLAAKEQGILSSVSMILERLQDCGFRCTDAVKANILHLAGESF